MIKSDSGNYKELHFSSIVADAHNDVVSGQIMKGRDISQRLDVGSTDLIRLAEGGVGLQVFAIFCNERYGKGNAYAHASKMIDAYEEMLRSNADKIAVAANVAEIRDIIKGGRIAAVMAVEGGHMIEGSLAYLDELCARGMKYLTLTWNNSTDWATSAFDETAIGKTAKKGLSEKGIQIIKRLNEAGVMVDLSHAGEQTFYDVLKISTKPVLVTHSNCYALVPHFRNLKDEQILAIKDNGGVIGVNFYSGFIDAGYSNALDKLIDRHRSLADMLSEKHTSKYYMTKELLQRIPKAEADAIRPPLSLLMDHIDHIVRLAGIDHVCLGSDFDGAESYPAELDDVGTYPLVTRELIERGYSDPDIKKILGENLLRVFKANEI